MPTMESHAKRSYLATALRDPEIRRTCRAVDRGRAVDGIVTAGLSATTLEVVRDYCADHVKGSTGTFSEFRRAWINLVEEHPNDSKTLERRLYYGITGKGIPGLAPHGLPGDEDIGTETASDTGSFARRWMAIPAGTRSRLLSHQ